MSPPPQSGYSYYVSLSFFFIVLSTIHPNPCVSKFTRLNHVVAGQRAARTQIGTYSSQLPNVPPHNSIRAQEYVTRWYRINMHQWRRRVILRFCVLSWHRCVARRSPRTILGLNDYYRTIWIKNNINVYLKYYIGNNTRNPVFWRDRKPDFTADTRTPPSPPRRGNGSNGGGGAGNPIHPSREFSKSFDAFPLRTLAGRSPPTTHAHHLQRPRKGQAHRWWCKRFSENGCSNNVYIYPLLNTFAAAGRTLAVKRYKSELYYTTNPTLLLLQ